jgi:hypothetical protein
MKTGLLWSALLALPLHGVATALCPARLLPCQALGHAAIVALVDVTDASAPWERSGENSMRPVPQAVKLRVVERSRVSHRRSVRSAAEFLTAVLKQYSSMPESAICCMQTQRRMERGKQAARALSLRPSLKRSYLSCAGASGSDESASGVRLAHLLSVGGDISRERDHDEARPA